MASLEPVLRDKGFQNWLKGALAILFAKQALDNFVADEFTEFQKDLLKSIFKKKSLPANAVCVSCTTENVLPCSTQNFCPTGKRCNLHDGSIPAKSPQKACPNNICNDIQVGICREHRFNKPSWMNTDATKWCTDTFEIAKCYMPPAGYSAVSSLAQTDFNGTLAVILNNKRFQNKFVAKLNQQKNVCTEAREVGRQVRHSADYTVSDTDIVRYIDILIQLLSDTKYLAADQKAQEAVAKMNQLKLNTLSVTTADITTILNASLEDMERQQEDLACVSNVDIDKAKTKREEEKKQLFHDIQASLSSMLTVRLDEIKISILDEIKRETERQKEELRKERELIKDEIRKEKGSKRMTEENSPKLGFFADRSLGKSLKEDLANFYRRYRSTIPVSPLVKQHDVPLLDFYVQPKFQSVEINYKLNEFSSSPAKRLVTSCQDLLICRKEPYKEIYVTAKAGIGKTSFAKRLCLTWCQAHFPDKKLRGKFEQCDTNTLKKFDYLFLIPLKETDLDICQVDDLVYWLIETYLPKFKGYTKPFIEKILHEKQVLIILDGLDEWIHPNTCRRKGEEIPHRLPHRLCTILTTTRPWKYASVKLHNSQIDMHAEICELDDKSSEKLVKSAIDLLNKNFGKSKDPKSIQDTISTAKLDSLKRIPYVLSQVTCLLFDELSIGESKCEIYSKVIELTLKRANLDSPQEFKENASKDETPPSCIAANELCISHYKMILSLGRLAFENLINSKSESTLAFDITVVQRFLSQESLGYFLNVGLLTQTRDSKHASDIRNTFSFQDKSIQEYFAALYMQSSADDQDTQERLLQVCDTFEDLLRMSNIFIFLGGFCSIACGKLLHLLQNNIMSKGQLTQRYRSYLSGRTSLPECRKTWEILKSFQSLQLEVMQEVLSNGHRDIPVSVEDLVIDGVVVEETGDLLTPLIRSSKRNIKSFSIEQCRSTEEFSEILKKFELEDLPCLEKLVISAVPKEIDLQRLLSGSVNTLKCLDLCFALYRYNKYFTEYTSLSSETIRTIFDMMNLQSIRLNSIRLIHSDVETLVEFVSNRTDMKEVGLCHIVCEDHNEACKGCFVDLSRHKTLETLRIGTLPVLGLSVNSSSLRYCYTGSLPTAVHSSLVRNLSDAANLTTLRLKNLSLEQVPRYLLDVLPKLKHLRNFAFELTEITDFEDVAPTLPARVENIHFYDITMSCKTLEKVIASVHSLQQHVTISLQKCIVTPESEYLKLKNEIRKSVKMYEVRFDNENRSVFSFQSRK